MERLEISKFFNVDDIRRIRDFNYETTKNMSQSEIRNYYKSSANSGFAEIERLKKTLAKTL